MAALSPGPGPVTYNEMSFELCVSGTSFNYEMSLLELKLNKSSFRFAVGLLWLFLDPLSVTTSGICLANFDYNYIILVVLLTTV